MRTLRRPGRLSRRLTRAARLHRRRGEDGQVTLLILGFTVVAILLIVGTVAVTSVQLSRMRLLDAADGAALDAADSLDLGAYQEGLGGAVASTTPPCVTPRCSTSRSDRGPRACSPGRWHPAPGAPDGETAVVRITAAADLPLVGGLLDALGGSVTITVESRARANLE